MNVTLIKQAILGVPVDVPVPTNINSQEDSELYWSIVVYRYGSWMNNE